MKHGYRPNELSHATRKGNNYLTPLRVPEDVLGSSAVAQSVRS
jgi:hypothetical protein